MTRRDWATLVVFGLVMLWGVSLIARGAADSLRKQINAYAQAQCRAGSTTAVVKKYNDQLQAQIDAATATYQIDVTRGQRDQAAIALAKANRLTGDRITVPTVNCDRPILKP